MRYTYDVWGNQRAEYLNENGNFVDIPDNFIYNNTSNINCFVAHKNPFRYRSYYYDFETGLYYLNSRYYDPELGRFINADSLEYLDPTNFNGLNLYAYCINNPVNLSDESGCAWWHWLIAAFVVVGLAIATVVTAGGFAPAAAAMVGVMSGVGAGSLGLSILAGMTVFAAAGFTAAGVIAGGMAISTWANGGSFSDGLNVSMGYGEAAMYMTFGSGVLGGILGFSGYKQGTTKYYNGRTDKIKDKPYSTYIQTQPYRKVTHFDGKGYPSWATHYSDHDVPLIHNNIHWHFELPHTGAYNNFFSFAWAYIKRIFRG